MKFNNLLFNIYLPFGGCGVSPITPKGFTISGLARRKDLELHRRFIYKQTLHVWLFCYPLTPPRPPPPLIFFVLF